MRGMAGQGWGEVTCDLPNGADDHGLVGSRPEQVAVAGAVLLLRVTPGVLQLWGCRATHEVLLQQGSAGQDDPVIGGSDADPVGRNAAGLGSPYRGLQRL